MIPQYNPNYNREQIAKEVSEYILGDNFFSENVKTKELEQQLASFLNVKHCIAVTNGTMAIVLALLGNGVKAGDYVLIPNMTMMSTQAALELIGAIPIWVDIDSNNLCMDLKQAKKIIYEEKLKSKIFDPFARKIKAIIYVTLNGRCGNTVDYEEFRILCRDINISLIEDNAQSFGSKIDTGVLINCPINGIGCFSLSFHKLLSTGQGGFCVTNDDVLGIRLRELKNVGRVSGGADIHDRFGINCKITDIQAIIGMVELRDIKEKIWNKLRIYSAYRTCLAELSPHLIQFIPTDLNYTIPWFVDIYTKNREERDNLQLYLATNGIQTRAIYPPLTSQKLNNPFQQGYNLPVSYQYANTGFWLPSSISLAEEEIKFICQKIKDFYVG